MINIFFYKLRIILCTCSLIIRNIFMLALHAILYCMYIKNYAQLKALKNLLIINFENIIKMKIEN